MTQDDERFVFEGRTIGEWLLQLVDEDSAKRKTAAKVVTDRFFMPMDRLPSTNDGVESFLADFSVAVRQSLSTPGFPKERFVEDVLSLYLAIHESWCEKSREESNRRKQLEKADLEKLGTHPSKLQVKHFLRRAWVDLLRDCEATSVEEPHEVMTTGIALVRVIDSLGAELLPAADILREMLFSEHKAYLASAAIARMGREGLEFYPDLIHGLERDDPNQNCPRALGALLKCAPEKIVEILALAGGAAGRVRINAIIALGEAGREAAGNDPNIESTLRQCVTSSKSDEDWCAAVFAMGQTAHTDESIELLLAQSTVKELGPIIVALGKIGRQPELVVPQLIHWLDTFEEYDPDCCQGGEHDRVIDALRSFDLSAIAAVPALIRHIWTKPQQYWTEDFKTAERPAPDEGVIRLLGDFGSHAKEALPALIDLREEMRQRSPDASGVQDIDDADSYWSKAIVSIQGKACL